MVSLSKNMHDSTSNTRTMTALRSRPSVKADIAHGAMLVRCWVLKRGYASLERYTMTKSIKLEVYYGVSSPWAYLGHARLLRIARENGITIHLKPITVIVENGGLPVGARVLQLRDLHQS